MIIAVITIIHVVIISAALRTCQNELLLDDDYILMNLANPTIQEFDRIY